MKFIKLDILYDSVMTNATPLFLRSIIFTYQHSTIQMEGYEDNIWNRSPHNANLRHETWATSEVTHNGIQ